MIAIVALKEDFQFLRTLSAVYLRLRITNLCTDKVTTFGADASEQVYKACLRRQRRNHISNGASSWEHTAVADGHLSSGK